MKIRVRNQPNFLSGLLFMVMGIGFAYIAKDYRMGSASQMGPGYFPVVLGSLLALIGSVVAIQSLSAGQEEEKVDRLYLKPMLLILGSIVLFGAMLLPFGFVVSSVVLITLTSLASPEFSWKYLLPMIVVLIIGCYLVFVYGLGLPMPIWMGGR